MVNSLLDAAGPEICDKPGAEGKIKKYFFMLTQLDDVALDYLTDDH